ncbi:MAG: hypothetical protein KGL70_02965, partial [Betaproteobacteria bacterium]|nr:hypothetical protein [Betaproteobacteria bacterium]
VTYGTRFVAVGSAGGAFTTEDGVTWTPADTGTTQNLSAVTFTLLTAKSIGVGYVAVGNQGTNLAGF